MKRHLQFVALSVLSVAVFSACQSGPSPQALARARVLMEWTIPNEPPGNYFIGRRVYKVDYKMWGYLRRPREPWSDARLVMLNEEKMLAPDRASNQIGSDNGFEYKVFGGFSRDRVYEPASNATYPEFVLKRTELLSTRPGPIFKDSRAMDPAQRYYPDPY